jgi:hypothetical protein
MDFSTVTKVVNEQLNNMSLPERVVLFRDIFKFPIDYKNGLYFYVHQEWEEVRMSDYLKIYQNWLDVHQFDRLYDYFEKLSDK